MHSEPSAHSEEGTSSEEEVVYYRGKYTPPDGSLILKEKWPAEQGHGDIQAKTQLLWNTGDSISKQLQEVIEQATTTGKNTGRGSPPPHHETQRSLSAGNVQTTTQGTHVEVTPFCPLPTSTPSGFVPAAVSFRQDVTKIKEEARRLEDECMALLNDSKRVIAEAPADQSIMELKDEERRLEEELISIMEESARVSQNYPQRVTVQMNGTVTSEDPAAETDDAD